MKKKTYILTLIIILALIFIPKTVTATEHRVESLNNNSDIYCVEEGTVFRKGIYEEVSENNCINTIMNSPLAKNATAYIIEKGNSYSGRPKATSRTAKQEAIWAILSNAKGWGIGHKYKDTYVEEENEEDVTDAQENMSMSNQYNRVVTQTQWQGGKTGPSNIKNSEADPGFVRLYQKAIRYSNFIKSGNAVANGTEETNSWADLFESLLGIFFNTSEEINVTEESNFIKVIDSNEAGNYKKVEKRVIVGPYKLSFNEEFGEIKDIKVNGTSISTTTANNIWISDENGNLTASKKIESNKEFYITIDISNTQAITNFGNQEITITYSYEYYKLSGKQLKRIKDLNGNSVSTNSDDQTLAKFSVTKEPKTDSVTIKIPNLIPPIEIKFKKVDQNGNSLNGITFKMYAQGKLVDTKQSQKVGEEDGIVKFDEYYPENLNDQIIQIEETFVKGYDLLYGEDFKTSKFSSNKDKLEATFIFQDGVWKNTTGWSGSEKTDEVINTAIIENLTLLKTDAITSNSLKGAKFKIKLENIKNVYKLNGTKLACNNENTVLLEDAIVDDNGQIKLERLEIADLTKNIVITLEETEAPAGYKRLDGTIKIILHREGTQLSLVSIEKTDTIWNEEFDETNDFATIDSTNHEIKLNIKNIPLIKLDLTKINKFDKINLPNAEFKFEFVDCELVTYSNGEKTAEESKTLTTDAEGKIPEIANIAITKKEGEGKIIITESKAPSDKYKNIENSLVLEIKWVEGELKVDKAEESKEGDFYKLATVETVGSENKISLTVENIPLMTIAGIVFQDNKVIDKVTEVDGDGKYGENDTPLSGVEVNLYKYNDVSATYINTAITDSEGKYHFDNVLAEKYFVEFIYDGMKYQTIAAKEYGSNEDLEEASNAVEDEEDRELLINSYKTCNEETGKFNEINAIGWPLANVIGIQYQGEAVDGGANSINLHVNCGLKERYFDLTLGLDIDSATVNIKGESETYQYNEILSKSDQATTEDGIEYYNLVQSKNEDKNYSLYLYESDYTYRKTDYEVEGKTNKLNPNEQDTIKDHTADLGEELSAIVTYKAIVHRQSKAKGYATKLINTYDNNFYTLYAIQDEKGNVIIRGEDNNWYKITDIVSETVEVLSADSSLNCSITTEGTAKITIPFYESEIEGFEENEQEIMLYYEIKNTKNEANELINFKEDAKPNSPVTLEIAEYYTEEGIIDYDSTPNNKALNEDDIDKAKPLVIGRKNVSRTISGNVFEDLEKDGDFNNSDPKIPNILVQLVEILEIGGANYEYIWQEKSTDTNGNYIFEGVLPGNYVVRFIYGDGGITEKYNALDYKSTYSSDYYEKVSMIKTDTKAFDNEARRIEQARSVKNKEEESETTWMCADTPKFTVEVDKKNKNENEQNKSASNVILKFEKVSFGLMQRPKEEIVLEKHLTKLEIAPFINTDGTKDGAELVPITGDRTNRGSWTIQFEDVTAAAGKLIATYSYNVINVGKEDYVFNSEGIKKVDGDDSDEDINRKEYSIGNYLAQYYYTGNKGSKDQPTTITVKGVEEIINPLFTATGGSDQTYKYYTSDAKLKEGKSTKVKLDSEKNLTGKGSNEELGTLTLTKDITSGMIAPTVEGLTLKSFIAELTDYTNDGGKRFTTTPKNLSYNNSEYNPLTLDSYAQLNASNNIIQLSDEEAEGFQKMNETDECWAEDIILTQNFGEDKKTPVTMILIITASAAVLGVGIILIKKFAIK